MHLVLNGTTILITLVIIALLPAVMYYKGYRDGRRSAKRPDDYRRLGRMMI